MRNLICSLGLLLSFSLSAQQHYCQTTERQNEWFAQHPELKAAFEKQQQAAADYDKLLYNQGYTQFGRKSSAVAAAGVYTIPVVFHILHIGGTENISDAQVKDAVKILTRDFNAANADTSDVVVQFKNLIGNPQIDFVLATKDPNGNCTNGIIRHYDKNTDWNNSAANYKYTWPPTRYMNVYVVRTMGGGAAGYTYLPGTGVPSVMDAIVILNNYVGSIGSGSAYTSRALTHEVGHWLNLPHVWGGTNQPGVACGDDGVSDTPVSKGYSSCNLSNSKVCNPGIVENVQNYMEYAYCQRMFTLLQSVRMVNALNSPVNGRNNLSAGSNLAFTGVTVPGTNCIPGLDIAALPAFTVCSGRALTVSSFTYNADPTSYLWTADNGALVNNASAPSTSILFNTVGPTNITCQVSNASGSVSKSITVMVIDGTPEITGEYSESFEDSDSSLPPSWKHTGPNAPSEKWEIAQQLGSHGILSMYAAGDMLLPNSVVMLESPSYDFKHNPGAQYTLKYAYALNTPSHKDLFKVQASKNCGGTWTDIWSPSSSSMAQGSGGITNDVFYPLPEQWKFKIVTEQPQFFSFQNEENVIFRFYFEENPDGTGSGNRMYLDEINFVTTVGVNELSRAVDLNVYPNPSKSDFTIGFTLSDASRISYQVLSITGSVLQQGEEKTYTTGTHELKLNTHSELAPGIYFVNLELNGVKLTRKVVIY